MLWETRTGPSAEARAKGVLKRQRKAGRVLHGAAAKQHRRAKLVARGVEDDELLDALTASVGLPGQSYLVHRAGKSKAVPLPLTDLPDLFQIQVVHGGWIRGQGDPG